MVDPTYAGGSKLDSSTENSGQITENCGRFQFMKSSVVENNWFSRFIRTTHAIRFLALLKSL